jgi:hypothetical protein
VRFPDESTYLPARVSGFRIPESEARATRRFDENGRLIGRIGGAPWSNVYRTPRWEAVQCPSAGIYPVPAPPETWRHYGELSAAEREAAAAYDHAFSRWTAGQRARFGQWPRNRVIEFPSYNHYFFLEKPEAAKQAIPDYLSRLP